jgi:hypothetical protein
MPNGNSSAAPFPTNVSASGGGDPGVGDSAPNPLDARQTLDNAEVTQAVNQAKSEQDKRQRLLQRATSQVQAVHQARSVLEERRRALPQGLDLHSLKSFVEDADSALQFRGSKANQAQRQRQLQATQSTLHEIGQTDAALAELDSHEKTAAQDLDMVQNMPEPPDPDHVAALVRARQQVKHAHEDRILAHGQMENADKALGVELTKSKKVEKPFDDASELLASGNKGVEHKSLASVKLYSEVHDDALRVMGLSEPKTHDETLRMHRIESRILQARRDDALRDSGARSSDSVLADKSRNLKGKGTDSQAVAWARAHPHDPRAAKIMQVNGVQ